MAEHTRPDLHYGFLGNVIYNTNETVWTCQRLPVHYAPLKINRKVFCINEKEPSVKRLEPPRQKQRVSSHRQDARRLAETLPQLAGAVVVLEELAREEFRNHAIASDHVHTSYTGSLLAFGVSYGSKSAVSSPAAIVAYAQGPDQNQLCIAQMRPFRQRADADASDFALSFLRPVPAIVPTWNCPTGRLLQIEFSNAREERFTLLAVRSPTTIYVFRPLLTTQTAKGSASWKSDHAHTVAANVLLQIRAVSILGSTCTDLVFNPYFQWQLVAIDEHGRFAVVEISKTQKASSPRAFDIAARGQVRELINDIEAEHSRLHRVVWLHSVHTFLTVGQRRVAVYDTRNPSVHLTALDLREDIVDVAKSPCNDNDLFILTTGHVQWIRIIALEGKVTTEIICSWRHYFDALGAELRITFRSATGSYLILYSRQTFLMCEYPLGEVEGEGSISWLVCNPSSIQKHDSIETNALEGTNGLHIVRLRGSQDHSSTENTRDFFQLFVLSRDGELTGYSCVAVTRQDGDQEDDTSIQATANFKRWQARVQTMVEDDWLVSDGDSNGSGLDDPAIRHQELRGLSGLMNKEVVEQSNGNGVSNEQIYEATRSLVGRELAELVAGVSEMLAVVPPIRQSNLFTDQTNSLFTIGDLDASESQMEVLLSSRPSTLKQSPIWPPSLFSDRPQSKGQKDLVTLSSIYDMVVVTWIGSLPSHVPARTRVRLERIARCMTASIWLGTHQIETEASCATMTTGPSQGAVLDALSSAELMPTSSQVLLPSSQPLPEPASSQGDDAAHETNNVNFAAQRLAKYTTLAKPPPPPPPPPTTTTSLTDLILSHWTVGTDPADYDFKEETARLSGTLNVTGSQMSAEVYARQKRRAAMQEERRQQRLQKRLRMSTGGSSVAGSSQSFGQPGLSSDRLWQSSQPQTGQSSGIHGLSQASQSSATERQAPQEMYTASQEQPGRHGGRLQPRSLAMRTKGKRKAGF